MTSSWHHPLFPHRSFFNLQIFDVITWRLWHRRSPINSGRVRPASLSLTRGGGGDLNFPAALESLLFSAASALINNAHFPPRHCRTLRLRVGFHSSAALLPAVLQRRKAQKLKKNNKKTGSAAHAYHLLPLFWLIVLLASLL